MFDEYDDSKKVYEIYFSDNRKEELTTQDLWEFFILLEHGIQGSFESFLDRLEKGEEIVAKDSYYDWALGTSIYKGQSVVKKIKTTPKVTPKVQTTSTSCAHSNKYINQAGGVKFWVCPLCKKDLGNA